MTSTSVNMRKTELGIVSTHHRTLSRSHNTSTPASYAIVKRTIDILIAGVAIIALAPLWVLIAIAIKLDSQGPVFFSQYRVRGQQLPDAWAPQNNIFTFFKFRSMYVNSDTTIHRDYVTAMINGQDQDANNGSKTEPVYKLKRDPRITRVGRFLRSTSLDELPQLLNILRGDMSLVGPRPALPYEVEQYAPHHHERLVPQAGLTGLWQVSGRTKLAFEEMVALDIEYSRTRSLWLDIKILFRTIPAVLSREGAC